MNRVSRSVSFETELYRPIPGTEEELEIEVEVEGYVEPYFAGSRDEPPSGGGAEDVVAQWWDDAAKKYRDIPLTEDEIRAFEERLAEVQMDRESDGDDDAYDRYYDR